MQGLHSVWRVDGCVADPQKESNEKAALDSPGLISNITGSPRNAKISQGGLTGGSSDPDSVLWDAAECGNVD